MKVTKATVRRCLLLATTMTKGVRPSDVTGDTVEAWFLNAQRHGMTDDGFKAAVDQVVDAQSFFPAWHEVLQAWKEARDEGAVRILDPVKTGEALGVDVIGSRALCLAADKPFVELRTAAVSALPSPSARDEARERLERSEAKVLEKLTGGKRRSGANAPARARQKTEAAG